MCWHKWGEIKERYQYCSKCGIARVVPCAHEWERTSEFTLSNRLFDTVTGYKILYQCKKCGETRIEKIGLE